MPLSLKLNASIIEAVEKQCGSRSVNDAAEGAGIQLTALQQQLTEWLREKHRLDEAWREQGVCMALKGLTLPVLRKYGIMCCGT